MRLWFGWQKFAVYTGHWTGYIANADGRYGVRGVGKSRQRWLVGVVANQG